MKILKIVDVTAIIALLILEILHDVKFIPFSFALKIISLVCAAVLLVSSTTLLIKKNVSWSSVALAGMFVIRWLFELINWQKNKNDELEQKKKELGDTFNEEDYGYIMYSSIQLKMNDGSLVDILNDKEVGTHVKKQLSGISVSLGLESYQVVLDDSVDLYQVNSVLVDGVEHTVDKTE